MALNDNSHWVEKVIKLKHSITKMYKVLSKKLGQNIKNARLKKHLSQERLAELIKKTRNYVGMVERAEINLPISVLFEIAHVLNIEPKELLNF